MDILKTVHAVDTAIETGKSIADVLSEKLAPGTKKFADRLYELSEKYPSLEELAVRVDQVAGFLEDAVYILGIVSDPADELGQKIANADKTASDFESVREYMKYLHDEVSLNEEEVSPLSQEERITYQTAGIAVQSAALGERLGVEISPDFMLILSKMKNISDIVISTTQIISLISSLKENGLSNMDDVCDYFKASGDSDRIHTGNIVRTAMCGLFGNLGIDLIEYLKMDARRS